MKTLSKFYSKYGIIDRNFWTEKEYELDIHLAKKYEFIAIYLTRIMDNTIEQQKKNLEFRKNPHYIEYFKCFK